MVSLSNVRSRPQVTTSTLRVLRGDWPSHGVRPDLLWDLHGASLCAMACALLGDESAALRAVTLGMVDLYAPTGPDLAREVDETLESAARCVHERCRAMLAGPPMRRTMTVPPLMVWIGEIAAAQRSALALCVYGGHTYREAAGVLGLSQEVVAGLLTSGLLELGSLSAGTEATP